MLHNLNTKKLSMYIIVLILANMVGWVVFGAIPHLEDEHVYLFQAGVFDSGRITADVSQQSRSFFELHSSSTVEIVSWPACEAGVPC